MPDISPEILGGMVQSFIQDLMKRPFDPEGDDYDYKSALEGGLEPDPQTGHWGSRNPQTGQILKGRKHETFGVMLKQDREQGYTVFKEKTSGKYYSFPDNEVLEIMKQHPDKIEIVGDED